MTGTLLVHIGLPKTATTTLQMDVFPQWAIACGFRYVGVYQPRGGEKDPIYAACMRAIDDPASIVAARGVLRRALEAHKLLVWSEEMLTVGKADLSWAVKLERLAELVKGFDFRILCTVRDPVDASFSYFVEINAYFRRVGKTYEQAVMGDDVMAIYSYRRLIRELEQRFGPYLIFSDLDGAISAVLPRLCREMGVESENRLSKPLLRRNEAKTAEGVVFEKRALTAADIFSGAIRKTGLSQVLNSPRLQGVKAPVRRVLDRFAIRKRAIRRPDAATKERIRQFYQEDWCVMKERMQQ